jgi:hypothetical protein
MEFYPAIFAAVGAIGGYFLGSFLQQNKGEDTTGGPAAQVDPEISNYKVNADIFSKSELEQQKLIQQQFLKNNASAQKGDFIPQPETPKQSIKNKSNKKV